MKFLYLIILLLYASIAHGQLPAFSWKLVLDGYNDVYLADIAIDTTGNTYVGVNYTAPLDIPGLKKKLPYPGHVHGLIIKLSPQGKPLWAHPFKSSFDNRIKDIALAPNGDLLVTGFGDGLLHFPGLHDTLKVGKDAVWTGGNRTLYQGLYAARYAPNGERKWVQYFNCPWGEGMSIAANRQNQVFMTFYHSGTLRLDNKVLDSIPRNSKREYRSFLARMEGNGKLASLQKLGDVPSNGYTTNHIRFDHEDNLLLFGVFRSALYLTPTDSLTLDSYYESLDSYLAKFDKEGRLLWRKRIGGQNTQVLSDISIAPDNSIYGTGTYNYECVLGDGINVLQKSRYEYKSGSSFFYFHLFDDGELDFIRYEDNKGYSSYFNGENIALDRNGNTHIVGYFTDTLRIDGLQAASWRFSNYTGLYTCWKGNRLQKLTKAGAAPNGFIFSWKIDIEKNFYALAGEYYGDSATLNTEHGAEPLPNKDYGRITYIIGGTVDEREEADSSEPLAKDVRETRLEMVKAITACTAANEPAPDVWLPLDTVKTKAPCGDEIKGMEVTLFPNPTSGEVKIKLTGITGTAQIEIFSDKGQLVLSHRMQDVTNGQIITLDLKSLSSGPYIVRVTHKTFQKGLRVVKVG